MLDRIRRLAMVLAPVTILGLAACEAEVEDEGELPEAEFNVEDGGELPDVNVEARDVDITEDTVVVPEVDVEDDTTAAM